MPGGLGIPKNRLSFSGGEAVVSREFTMNASIAQPQEPQALSGWLQDLDSVLREVETWAAEEGWHTRRFYRRTSEDAFGEYDVPVLDIEVEEPHGRIVLEPVGRNVLGAAGRIDVYAWPAMLRVKLLRVPATNEWIVRTDSGVNLPGGWNKQTLLHMVSDWLKEE